MGGGERFWSTGRDINLNTGSQFFHTFKRKDNNESSWLKDLIEVRRFGAGLHLSLDIEKLKVHSWKVKKGLLKGSL